MFGWLRKRWDEFGRSGRWPTVRKKHLESFPNCAACGRSRDIEVHHVQPYHDHPELELDESNLLSLCREPCHFVFGHLLNWSHANPHVRLDAARYLDRMRDYGAPE